FSQMPEIAGDEMHIRPRAFQYFFRASDCIGIQIETDQHSLFSQPSRYRTRMPRAAERRVYDTIVRHK
ncbi:MAG: hypothetical protein AAB665_00805, partial [Patescibacteria group bacterium]